LLMAGDALAAEGEIGDADDEGIVQLQGHNWLRVHARAAKTTGGQR
jgi:hypothetical protein